MTACLQLFVVGCQDKGKLNAPQAPSLADSVETNLFLYGTQRINDKAYVLV
jgi:hypothetical protein